MKKSVRALRIERHHKRMAKTSKLSLVSLMDIFTILVFFLIVNSSSVEVLEADKSIKLPSSVAEKLAEDSLVLLVNNTNLILQGKKITTISAITNSDEDIILSLKAELDYRFDKQIKSSDPAKEQGSITIMGDKKIPYAILKKILLTCSNSGFGNISLAVEKAIDTPQEGDNA